MATETTKLTFIEGAAAATPAANRSVIYVKADGLFYSKDDAGAETPLGGGSSDLDAIITASAGQDIADALSGAAAPDSGNVFATMADVGGGGGSTELGYAQITADVTTTSTTVVDATGLTVTVTAPATAIIVEAWGGELTTTGSAGGDTRAIGYLYDTTGSAVIALGIVACVNGSGSALTLKARVTPGAGSRSYKVRFNTVQAGTATIRAAATSPAFIRVTTA